MKFSLLSLCLALLVLTSCGPDKKTARISGKIEGLDQAALLIYSSDAVEGDQGSLDSIYVNRGSFSYDRPTTQPLLLTLVYPNNSFTTLIAEPGKEVKLAGDANRLKEMQVTGTDDNKQFSEFCFSVLKLNEKDAQMRAATYIRSHPQSLTSVALFYHYFDRVAQRNEQPTLELLNLLRKQQPTNQQLTAIDARLRPQLRTAVGAKLPHFTASTLNKQAINSADFKGKPTLLIFSANWDSNNYYLRQQLRKLKAARGQRLRIINFALDESLEKAQERAKNDSLQSVVYLKHMLSNPLVQTLGLRYPSGNILINADGHIIGRDFPIEELANKVNDALH